MAKLPLQLQTGTRERTAAMSDMAGENTGGRRCNAPSTLRLARSWLPLCECTEYEVR
ncbi:MAG: hypothetical protein R3E39_05755 [Anaerolineae bacterium]